MSATATKLVTVEEFMSLSNPADGSLQELVRGEVILVPPPKARHGVICNRIGRLIGNYVDANRLG